MMKKFVWMIGLLCSCGMNAQEYTLAQLQEMAVQNNRTLKNARLAVDAAKEDKANARTNFFPQVSASGVGFRGFDDLVQSTMEVPGMGALDMAMVKKGVVGSVMAVQPVFQGGQIVTGNKLAAIGEEVKQLQMRMSEKDVALQVAQYYWQIVSLQSQMATLDSVKVQLDEVHRQTENYVKAGVITRNDLLRGELKQQEVASNRLELENGISIVKLLLEQLVGTPLSSQAPLSSPEIAPPTAPEGASIVGTTVSPSGDERGALALAWDVTAREEYLLAEKNEEAQRLNVRMERGRLLPSVAVGVNGYYQSIDSDDHTNGMVFATLSVPISDWWGGSHAVRKAKLLRLQAENDRMEVKEKLAIGI